MGVQFTYVNKAGAGQLDLCDLQGRFSLDRIAAYSAPTTERNNSQFDGIGTAV